MSETSLPKKLLEKNKVPEQWQKLLLPLMEQDFFYEILSALAQDVPYVAPDTEDIFAVFREIDPEKVDVIILGQDPYPQPNVATGIAYANKQTQLSLSPSLMVILDELIESNLVSNEFVFFNNSDLIHWCKQGILLLNSSLTVKYNKPSSHKKAWRPFMEKFLPLLDKEDLIVVMTGSQAADFSHCFQQARFKYKVPHPAADTYSNARKFRGTRIFNKIDSALVNMGKEPINWQGKL